MVHEYREALCLAHAETIWGWPIKVDLSNFGNEWTECIDQEWLKVLPLLCFNNLYNKSCVFPQKTFYNNFIIG